jgi:glycosyltransferase involved in cell wall biosynthesis
MVDEALTEGHEVAVSLNRWPSARPRVDELQSRGVRILERPAPRWGRVARLKRRISPPFAGIARFRPDVLFVSEGSAYDTADYWPVLTDWLRASGTPYVVVCHLNAEPGTPTPTIRERAVEFFARAHRVAFVSERDVRTAERHLMTRLTNAVVVRNPVNMRETTPVAWPASATPVCFASVARLGVKHKGQDILLEAFSAPEWQQRDWRLRLYGSGPDSAYLEGLARHLGLGRTVEFMGHVSDIRRLWSENHMLILASRAEGAPLAMVEAMLCGRPALLTDVGGNTEWIDEPRTGFIAAAPTVTSLRETLERAWSQRAAWQQMGMAAQEAALARFDPSPGKSVLTILTEAAGASPARQRQSYAPPTLSTTAQVHPTPESAAMTAANGNDAVRM